MITLIQGANNSGKSAYAEKRVVSLGGVRYYIATMIPYGAEGRVRVARHRKQREGLGFITLELPYELSGADVPPDCSVLVEDVSNLLANHMFDKGNGDVFEDIKNLCGRVKNAVIVTINHFDDGDYDEETVKYIAAMGALNKKLSDFADEVVCL